MQDTEIIFIGTGDAFNSDGYANQAILLTSGAFWYLVDAGPTTLCEMMRLGLNPERLTGIFITHFHGDHTGGLPFLLLYLKMKARVTSLPFIAGPKGILEKAHELFEAAYQGEELGAGIEFIEIPWTQARHISFGTGVHADVFPMKHKPESLGYRFDLGSHVISVTGDTMMNDNIYGLFDSADVGIIECTYQKQVNGSHFSLETIKSLIDELGCRILVPIHNSNVIREELIRWAHPRIAIVGDGKSLRI